MDAGAEKILAFLHRVGSELRIAHSEAARQTWKSFYPVINSKPVVMCGIERTSLVCTSCLTMIPSMLAAKSFLGSRITCDGFSPSPRPLLRPCAFSNAECWLSAVLRGASPQSPPGLALNMAPDCSGRGLFFFCSCLDHWLQRHLGRLC